MSKEYLDRINNAFKGIEELIKTFGEEYHFIITADHGGHERMHGTTDKEDMTIPQFYFGKKFTAGKEYTGISILDVAPTISDILGIGVQPEWEGTSILKK
jgi:phosphopentomutase